MKQQHTLQPKVRFPEFEEDWNEFSFKEIFNFTTGKNIKQKEAAPNFETPCVRYGELYYMYKEVISNIINYTNLDKSELKFSEGDEILLPSAGEDPMDIGSASALTLKNVAIGRTINILKPKNENVYSSIFASYYINQKLRIKISGLAKGVSISNVYNTDLQTLFIKLPSLPEQQKIADYLSTIDTKINLLEEKKAQLALYKKAMMQKLFSQEIRFKPTQCHTEPVEVEPVEVELMETYPEWEEKRLGNLGKFGSGTGFSESEQGGKNGIPFIKVSDMNLLGNEIYITRANNYVSDIQVAKNKYKVISKPSIIFAKVGAAIFLERKRIADNFLIDNNMMAFTPNGSILFYYYLFINIRLCKFSQTGALPSYNSSDISTIKVKVPSLTEQQKIADFLLAIDESIEKVNEQITQTQSFKKAMLQQMFV